MTRALVVLALLSTAIPAAASDDGLRLSSAWLDEDDGVLELGQKGEKKSGGGGGSSFSVGPAAGDVAPMGYKFGVGLQLGSPTALTAKYMLTYNQGIQGGFGVGLGGLSLHCDFVWHPHVLARGEPFRLSWYLGLGGWLGFMPFPSNPYGFGYYNGHVAFVYLPAYLGPVPLWATPTVAVRVPLGMSIALNALPLELFAGLTPTVLVFPGIGFGMGFEVGARLYF